MTKANTIDRFDTVVIGAGILGLWAARYAIEEGRSVCVVDEAVAGAGASGGLLGALMSHIPDGWNIKKEFQFQALDQLEPLLAKLEKDTGMIVGYRRCGRIMPLAHKGMISHVDSWLLGAQTNWQGRYAMEFFPPEHKWFEKAKWPESDIAPFGASHDTFAARVSPRLLVAALAQFVRAQGEIRDGCRVREIDMQKSEVVLADGGRITGKEIIVANGVDAYRLLFPFMGEMNSKKPLGRGVRGQAIMLDFAHDDTLPILYCDGTYVVPHTQNRIAIGSTSHNVQLDEIADHDLAFDESDMPFYDKAMRFAPMLKDAPIVEKWAGMRPRNTLEGRGADPWFEPVPDHENLIALIGGFKITFGIAHRAMDVARGKIEGPRRQKLSWAQ